MTQETVTREEIRERYEDGDFPTDDAWENYGDVNPEYHGGRWISYDPDHGEWTVYQTIHADLYLEDADPDATGDQLVQVSSFQWRDIVTALGEWKGPAASEVEALSNAPETPLGAAVDDRLTWIVAGCADRWSDPYPYRDNRHQKDSYDDVLDSLGIVPADDESDD